MPQEPAVTRFAEELRSLRVEAGNPPFAEIARLSGHRIMKAAIRDQLSGKSRRLPDAAFVTAFYEACLALAKTGGRGSDRLGTLDQWLDLLAAADREREIWCLPSAVQRATVHAVGLGMPPGTPGSGRGTRQPPAPGPAPGRRGRLCARDRCRRGRVCSPSGW